jgi:hypothetical protein
MARPKSQIDLSSRKPAASQSSNSSASGKPNSESARRIASERIAGDIEAFRAAGGSIEVLAITRPLDATDGGGETKAASAPKAPIAAPRK